MSNSNSFSTSSVDRTMLSDFQGWDESDECQWIAPDNTHGSSSVYINLQLNPEGYTGYEGEEAHRIWRAIYEQNCFNAKINPNEEGYDINTNNNNNPSDSSLIDNGIDFRADNDGLMRPAIIPNTSIDFNQLCLEQRVFYRLVSGLHASISAHISNAYPVTPDVDPYIDLHAPEHCSLISPSIDEFQRRVGNYPERITNLYFAFVFMLRAVNKASDTLRNYNYNTSVTGKENETNELITLMDQLLSSSLISKCSKEASFDEASMFASPSSGPYLKNQLRSAFHNISRIMNCVGCEKCKLHGKLQILGLGTALRILFQQDYSKQLKLERNEVMALIVTLAKFSHALHITRDMNNKIAHTQSEHAPKLLQPQTMGPILLASIIVATSVFIFMFIQLCQRRGPTSVTSRSRRNSLNGNNATTSSIIHTNTSAANNYHTKGNGHTSAAAAAAMKLHDAPTQNK
jgi:hypothetical protein